MKVSVIVPVFNAEKYIRVCLDSIQMQTYKDYETIIVDDGSTDASGAICDQFAERNQRFQVIHKKNEGLICARKTGIMAAKGHYIAFVDADDWIDADFLETNIGRMEQVDADIVAAGCVKETDGRSEIIKNNIPSGVFDASQLTQEIYPSMLNHHGFYEFGILPYIWNKIYKKELLEPCYADIDTKIYDGEDVAIVYPYLLTAKRAVVTEDAKYHYRVHGASMTAKKKSDYYENAARLYLYLAAKFQQTEYSQLMMPQLDHYMRMMIWQGNPGSFIESLGVIFPFQEVPKGARIILYGAGYAGRAFHHQICLSGYCDIAAWVDQAYEQTELNKMGVVGLEALQTETYDYVVLAVRTSDLAENITTRLLSCGVDEGKIIFCAQ